jgi:hypothetical protein
MCRPCFHDEGSPDHRPGSPRDPHLSLHRKEIDDSEDKGCVDRPAHLPWYAAVYAKEGRPYLQENMVRQNFTRFFDAWSHKRPFYYYFTTLPLDYFPWSLFLPMGLYLSFRAAKENPGIRFFLIWFLWMFAFLSLSSGKISKYMLPVLPALSLIASLALPGEKSKYNAIVLHGLSILFLVLAGFLFLYKTNLYPEFYTVRTVFGALSIVLSTLLFLFTRKRRFKAAFLALFFFMAAIYTMANVSVYSKLNAYKSPRPLCEQVKTYIKNGWPWVYYGSMRGVYVYYVGTNAIHVDEHRSEELSRLADVSPQFFILTRKRDLKEVRRALKDVIVVFEEKVGETPMIFLQYSNYMPKR